MLSLIGYRGTGKTTLARLLAERLGWPWMDADLEIERRAGKSVARIFAEDGEPVFRDLETRVIAELCRRRELVLAAGGGAAMRAENRRAMPPAGSCGSGPAGNYPRADVGRRRHAGRRPALTEHGPLEEIVQLLGRREPMYREAAHLVIDTEDKSPEQLADEILTRLELDREATLMNESWPSKHSCCSPSARAPAAWSTWAYTGWHGGGGQSAPGRARSKRPAAAAGRPVADLRLAGAAARGGPARPGFWIRPMLVELV